MTGKRKLFAFCITITALTLAGWFGFLTETLMQGSLGALFALAGGNAAEHFSRRNGENR